MNLSELEKFPVWEHTQDICEQLKNSPSRFLILTAETGAGKSTILPVGLLNSFSGKIIVTEPRRLAVLGTANRVSDLLEEECGTTCGYRVHLEKKVSKNTRLEFVTEAIMVKELQTSPDLEGISVVVIDEFHERSISTDLVLAFLKEAMELRDDLYVIVMSATINTQRLEKFLNCPVVSIPGRMFPVSVEYKGDGDLQREIINQVQSGITILVFIPSIGDIKRNFEKLRDYYNQDDSVEIMILHSSISLEEQKKVLVPAKKNVCRIILSSAIAETSLTVPGVSVVIDTGLCRINKIDLNTGMGTLVTERETEFSALQRCGRAGREMPGKCIRLWHKEDKLVTEQIPEILRTDLCSLILECAERGVYSREGIDWFDAPLESGWKAGVKLLQSNDCLGKDGKITEIGRIVLKLGLEIRLACVAVYGFDVTKMQLTEECKTILVKYSQYKDSSENIKKRFIEDISERLKKSELKNIVLIKDGPLILKGFSDRLAKKVSQQRDEAEYQFQNGKKAILHKAGTAPEWIVAPQVLAGSGMGIIFEYETLEFPDFLTWIEEYKITEEICSFENGKILKEEVEKLGEIVLKTKKLNASSEDYGKAWIGEVKKKGLKALPLNEKIENLILRSKLYRKTDVEAELTQQVEDWLLPFITGGKKVDETLVYDSLFWYLQGQQLAKEVPELIILENGQKCKVHYEKQKDLEGEKIKPVIEIIIQRAFRCKKIPEICGQKVLIKLLSPASRPLQITEDLEGFWSGAWKEICKEMKGRYPKHDWSWTGD